MNAQPGREPLDVLAVQLQPQFHVGHSQQSVVAAEDLLDQRAHGNRHHLVERRVIAGQVTQLAQSCRHLLHRRVDLVRDRAFAPAATH